MTWNTNQESILLIHFIQIMFLLKICFDNLELIWYLTFSSLSIFKVSLTWGPALVLETDIAAEILENIEYIMINKTKHWSWVVKFIPDIAEKKNSNRKYSVQKNLVIVTAPDDVDSVASEITRYDHACICTWAAIDRFFFQFKKPYKVKRLPKSHVCPKEQFALDIDKP